MFDVNFLCALVYNPPFICMVGGMCREAHFLLKWRRHEKSTYLTTRSLWESRYLRVLVGCASEDSDTAEGADSAAEGDTEAQDDTATE